MVVPALRPQLRIAVIDDDDSIRELVRSTLVGVGANVDLFEDARQFMDRAVFTDFDVILCDLVLPGLSGIDLLFEVREKTTTVPFVIMSGHAAVPDAIEAMKGGAADFLVKPFRMQSLVEVVRNLTQTAPPRTASGMWLREKDANVAIGSSPAWKTLLEKARRVSEMTSTVLIRGETGSGKEVLAKYIASFGPRAGKPFVTLNCAAIPEDLIETELFGVSSGSFTAVTGSRKGLFEEAEGGTLFLNEVGSMPGPAQVKVLRALEEFQIRRIGDSRTVAVDVRILAATNLDLEAAVARQEFRNDLYYRLAVVTLWVPPLRERGEDKLLLADYFLRKFSGPSEYPRRLSAEARDLILHDPFPGNARELKHAIEQAAALSTKDELVPDDFPLLLARADEAAATELASSSGVGPRTITPERLREVLERTRGNRVEAARQLRISRSTLYRMLGKLPS